MTDKGHADALLARAAYADAQAEKTRDRQVKESWQAIADSCRELAHYSRLGHVPPPQREPAP